MLLGVFAYLNSNKKSHFWTDTTYWLFALFFLFNTSHQFNVAERIFVFLMQDNLSIFNHVKY